MILGFDIGGTKCAVMTAEVRGGTIKLLKKEIPIALTVKEYTICDTKKELRSKNKLEKILIEKNKKYIEKNFGKNAKITDFKTEFSKSGAKVTAYFTTNENIAVPESIIIEEQN